MCAGTARIRAIGDSGVGVRGVVVTAAVLAAGLTSVSAAGVAMVAAAAVCIAIGDSLGGVWARIDRTGSACSEVCSDAGGDAACPDEAAAARCAPPLGVLTTTGLWTAAVEMSGAVEAVSADDGLAAASDEVLSAPWPEVSSGVSG
jgi:hypothetical protein